MLITSVNNDKIKELVKLKDKKYRDLNNLFFVEGKDLCDSAYEHGLLRELYILDGHDNIYDARDVLVRTWLMILELTVKDEFRK